MCPVSLTIILKRIPALLHKWILFIDLHRLKLKITPMPIPVSCLKVDFKLFHASLAFLVSVTIALKSTLLL